MASTPLPPTHRALVLKSTSEAPEIQTLPTLQPSPGSVVVKVLVANVVSYMRGAYNGQRNYPFPTPLVIGTGAIGRIAAIGPDTTLLEPGQLVLIDIAIRARDDPSTAILSGILQGVTPGSAKLMSGEWRDSTYAEYVKMPLENCRILDETRLLGSVYTGGLGYSIDDLSLLSRLIIPYGGLRDIDLRAGETVVVAPATGSFGGAAVMVALALGAKVIAMGRNVEALKKIAAISDHVKIVPITGDQQAETAALLKHGPIDAYFDISPPEAAKSTHIKAALYALKVGGRVSLMGGITEDVPIPIGLVTQKNILLKGTWMYTREAVGEMIKMVELGVLGLGHSKISGRFKMEEWDEAFECAEKNAGFGEITLLAP
ncbi:alcohol dehydrogenase [Gymnopilus junonius]|uniref:Alcohol dehydrogenase n=1 Tax=Gymnopilus junonius TaxID=109634 RepID=A0A9P5NAZ8_GYMJU|nr:alcohol dehydrogenase [Gymnopilus junonius]